MISPLSTNADCLVDTGVHTEYVPSNGLRFVLCGISRRRENNIRLLRNNSVKSLANGKRIGYTSCCNIIKGVNV